MNKEISVKTASGTKLYKISGSGSRYYCSKISGSFFSSWVSIGQARNMEDALSIIKSHAQSKYGHLYSLKLR